MNNKIQLLICDLDNTLYDWIGYFVPSFYAMIDKATNTLGCDKEKLLDDFKIIHQRHNDSEYPFALLETDSIVKLFPNDDKRQLYEHLAPIFLEFKAMQKKTLALHAFVHGTLEIIHNSNIKIVAHTEANLFAVIDRLDKLELTSFFERIYCREGTKTPHPNGMPKNKRYSTFPYEKVVELSHHQRKPDETVLLEICNALSINPQNAAYVGDSMARDILMAAKANVFSIFAAYGSQHEKGLYDKLVRITHWTSDEVAREIELQKEAGKITPDYTLKNNFSEILIPLGIG